MERRFIFLVLSFVVLWLVSCSNNQQRNEAPLSAPTAEQPSPAPSAIPITPLSKQARKIQLGMTPQEVVALLGRSPDTVLNDAIRQELKEPVSGFPTLITYEWSNGENCQPVSVDFDKRNGKRVVTGWNEGRTCTGKSTFNEPVGKSCKNNKLCKF